jgi:hypothetical protein
MTQNRILMKSNIRYLTNVRLDLFALKILLIEQSALIVNFIDLIVMLVLLPERSFIDKLQYSNF